MFDLLRSSYELFGMNNIDAPYHCYFIAMR